MIRGVEESRAGRNRQEGGCSLKAGHGKKSPRVSPSRERVVKGRQQQVQRPWGRTAPGMSQK